jgi:S1-C subfamily serine protease
LRISATDLDRAQPLPVSRAFFAAAAPPAPTVPRRSRLAIAAFIASLLGVPILFGGLVAIILGSLALGAIRKHRQKGTVLALLAVLLGLAETVAWVLIAWSVLTGHVAVFSTEDFGGLKPPDPDTLRDAEPKIARAMRANVLVQTGQGWVGKALGSGVILEIDKGSALILTNRHVVDPEFSSGHDKEDLRALAPEVMLVDGQVESGSVVWLAPGRVDLALVRVRYAGNAARAAKWKLGRKLRVGEAVFALGNPHGLSWSFTDGKISQFRRHEEAGRRLRVIQTTAVINPGNSGGGLYDPEGFLVGINTWSNDKRVSEGLSFAIALDALRSVSPPGLDLDAGSKEADQP